MHHDESLPARRQPVESASVNPGNKLPAPRWAKDANAMPGGVPPMFAGPAERAGLGSSRTPVDS